jgi:hypothetical protein
VKRNDALRHIQSETNVRVSEERIRHADVNEEQAMTWFLLGALAPSEREPIEERLVADPMYFEALCALEDELILKSHRGELSHTERRLFAQTYLSSPARQARVASVRDLIDATEEWKAGEEARSSVWNQVRRWLAAPRQVPQFAVAGAVALLVVAMPVAVYQAGDAMRRLQRAERENTALWQQIGTARYLAVVFTLTPGGGRGKETADGTNLVRIPRDADEAWLQFEMADPGTAVGLEAILEPVGGTLVAKSHPARVARTATAALVTVTVAASDLPDGDYVLRLRRAATGGSRDIVATRAFRVTRE